LPLILRDIFYSARSFTRTPGLAFALLFTISLGIGANVAIHGFIRGLTGRPVPGVVAIYRSGTQGHEEPLSYRDFLSLQRSGSFEWIGAAGTSQKTLTLPGRSIIASVAAVTPEIAALFQLPAGGSGGPGGSAVISHRMKRDGLLREGTTARIAEVEFTIAATAPEHVEGIFSDLPIDIWIQLRDPAPDARVWVFGKLKPEAAMESSGVLVVSFTGMTPEKARGLERVAAVLRAAAASVFFIACANVAAFLLGRATARSHETSLRVAIGAGRKELSRGVLSDSIVISVAGGALGVLLAIWTTKIVPALLFQEDAERLVFSPDPWSIATATLAGITITIACGLLPLLAMPHNRPAAVLRREGAGPSKAMQVLRSSLVIGQMACCCLLVVATGLLLEGLRSAMRTTISRATGEPVIAAVQTALHYKYFEDIQQEASAMRGVTPLAWTSRIPGSQPDWRSYRIEPLGAATRAVRIDVAAFTPDSISLFTLPPKAGRLFGFVDRTCNSAIVNESAAEALLGSETVGRALLDPAGRRVQVIGVVKERNANRRVIYFNHTDRTTAPPATLAMAAFRAPVTNDLQRTDLDTFVVSPGYFAAMGVALTAGRLFTGDTQGCRVAVVNQEAANLYFGGKAAGATVIDEMGRRTEIIGVVDAPPLSAFQRSAPPAIYLPVIQDFPPRMMLILGVHDFKNAFLAEALRKFQRVPGSGPLPISVQTVETYVSRMSLAPLRIATAIVSASAAIALLLSMLGLFGALDDAARRRSRELAVRIALGARRRHLIAQVLREGGTLALAGSTVGLLAAAVLARLLAGIVPSSAPELHAWFAGPAVLAAAVVLSGILPARRASLVDPLRIMRDNN